MNEKSFIDKLSDLAWGTELWDGIVEGADWTTGKISEAMKAAARTALDQPGDPDLFQSKYDFTYRRFPMNLGDQSYNGHYMVININVQTGTRFAGAVTNDRGQKLNTFSKLLGADGKGELSKTDVLRFNIDNKWKDSAGQSFDSVGTFPIPRRTRRIIESIALYMPNTVVFDTVNDYEDVGLTAIGAGLGSAAAQIASGFASPGVGRAIRAAVGGLSAAASLGSTIGQIAQRPINPRIGVLFRDTLQRTFQFDF